MHPRSFDEVSYITMPDGAPILPPKAKMVIPVGTKVNVLKIEWPDLHNYMNRPIFTPRDLPWMKVKVAMQRGAVSMMRDETFIFLVPTQSDDADHFELWFKTIFSDKDTNPWFLSQKEDVQNAILNKSVTIGMSKEALLASLGAPNSWSQDFGDEGTKSTKEIANYYKQVIVLENGVVSKVQALTPSTPAQFHKAARTLED
jgi:hypothetical protein